MTRNILILFLTSCLFSVSTQQFCYGATIEDRTHYSRILGMNRNYRVFLPPDYGHSGKHYPVLYWFHGSGGSSKQLTYKDEFEDFVNSNVLIIVNVDGTTGSGATWDYGLAFEYDRRTQENNKALTGMFFSKYIRELVAVVDSVYSTIPDRDHRAVSGQSMGGLMAPWIESQNKDLFGSASLFSPSPDAAMFGLVGREVCFVNRELYRSLKGIPLRLTAANGDRYIQYYHEQKAVWELADLTSFEFHIVNYPDHRAVDIPQQFKFHMNEFARIHQAPCNWNHADPFARFTVWNYDIDAIRNVSAFTILEKVTPEGMLVCSRSYLPEGPIISDEEIRITTDTIYLPSELYILTDFNRSSGEIIKSRLITDPEGRLTIRLNGGGHALGINRPGKGIKLYLMPEFNREEIYCETGIRNTLSFTLLNAGENPSGPLRIRATTAKPYLSFEKDTIQLTGPGPGQKLELKGMFPFRIVNNKYDDPDNENFITKITLEVSGSGMIPDKSDIFIYPVSGMQRLTDESDLVILDGTSAVVRCYENRLHRDTLVTVSGGQGNGNMIPEPGETVEIWVRLAQGLGHADTNTFHPAFLVNKYDDPMISVPELKYNIKGAEYSGAANLQSRIRIDPETPYGHKLDLWLKCESYEFSEEGFNRPLQRHTFDYRRVTLRTGVGRHTR